MPSTVTDHSDVTYRNGSEIAIRTAIHAFHDAASSCGSGGGGVVTVVLYGAVGTGKSWWLSGHLGTAHDDAPTLGYDVKEERVCHDRGETTVRWVDTSGDDRWVASQPWFPRVDLVVFVFSPQDHGSWLGVPNWIDRANGWHRGAHERLLLGVRRDGAATTVPHDAVLSVSMLFGLTYVECDGRKPCGLTASVRALCCGAQCQTSVNSRFVQGGGMARRTVTPDGCLFSCRCPHF